MANDPIIWEPKYVELEWLKINPKNPKILSDQGTGRLNKSLAEFGLAGTMVANLNGDLIDGHSRKKDLVEQGIIKAWVSLPNRLLTDKEYKRFNAVFDIAKAGMPDIMIMEEVLGEEFLDEWELRDAKLKVPGSDELTADAKNKPAILKITFPTADEFLKIEKELLEFLKEKSPKAIYSVSAGEL